MGLTKSTIRNKTRILLNELVQGFWLNSELDGWIDDAALDISTKTYCNETISSIALSTGVSLYTAPIDCLRIIAAIYNTTGQALKRLVANMLGIQSAAPPGPPEFFYEFALKVGFYPTPTISENTKTISIYHSLPTNNIRNIPLKFQVPAVLFTLSMGLAKERQYARAAQVQQLYMNSLSIDRKEVQLERIEVPAPLTQYVLKMSLEQPTQQGQ